MDVPNPAVAAVEYGFRFTPRAVVADEYAPLG